MKMIKTKKMVNINNKLLESVLFETLSKHDPSFKEVVDNAFMRDINSLMINYKDNSGLIKSFVINIYELTFKVKEWAYKNDCFLFSGFGELGGSCEVFYKKATMTNPNPQNIIIGEQGHISETEAIFKAGEWILKQIKDKK